VTLGSAEKSLSDRRAVVDVSAHPVAVDVVVLVERTRDSGHR